MIIDEHLVVFILAVVVIVGIKSNSEIDYHVFDRVNTFIGTHVAHNIPIPFLGAIFEWVSASFLNIVSYNMGAAKLIDRLYNSLPNWGRSRFNIVLFYLEIVVVTILFLTLFVMMRSMVAIVANATNRNDSNSAITIDRKLHIVILVFGVILLTIYALVVRFLHKKESETDKHDGSETERKFSNLLQNILIAIFLYFVFTFVVKMFTDKSDAVDSVTPSNELYLSGDYARILDILKDVTPIFGVLYSIGIFSITFQSLFSAYHTSVGGNGFIVGNVSEKQNAKIQQFCGQMFIVIALLENTSIYLKKS